MQVTETDRQVDLLTDSQRQQVEALGFAPAGAWLYQSNDGFVMGDAHMRAMFERLEAGHLVEVWISADGHTLLDASHFLQDLSWSMLSMLEDGTVIRSLLHSEHDAASSAQTHWDFRGSGYERLVFTNLSLEALASAHAERLLRISRERGSSVCTLLPEDYPQVEHRALEIVSTHTDKTIRAVSVLGIVCLGLALLLLPGPYDVGPIGPWLKGAAVAGLVLAALVYGPWSLFRFLLVRLGDLSVLVRAPRVPAREVLARF